MENKEIKYLEEFKNQETALSELLYEGEEMKQCLDKISFNGRFYNPCWVATNMGRVYSLARKRWLSIQPKEAGKKNKEGQRTGIKYYYIGGKIAAHTLTANYFCDKSIVEKFGECNVEVHHNREFDEKKSLIENNNALNLCYAIKDTHRNVLTPYQKGKLPKNVELDNEMKLFAKTFAYQDDSTIYCIINEDGNEEIRSSIPLKGKFFSDIEWQQIKQHSKAIGYLYVDLVKVVRKEDGNMLLSYSNKEKYLFSPKDCTFTELI